MARSIGRTRRTKKYTDPFAHSCGHGSLRVFPFRVMPVAEYIRSVPTEVGLVRIAAVPDGVCGITFTEETDLRESADGAPTFLDDAVRQLREYFAGTRTSFDSLPLVLRSTDFQRSVWDAAMEIPYGGTVTYAGLAKAVGKPDAARAVGNALNRNPLCIIVPCHRIVASTLDGGGYAGSAWRKEWLLNHEKLPQ